MKEGCLLMYISILRVIVTTEIRCCSVVLAIECSDPSIVINISYILGRALGPVALGTFTGNVSFIYLLLNNTLKLFFSVHYTFLKQILSFVFMRESTNVHC